MTMRHLRRGAPLAIASGLVLVLAACGGGGGGSSSPTDAAGNAPTDDHTPGPLEKMWTDTYGDFAMDPDDMNAQQARVEQLVAECMAEQGWEYTPVDYSSVDEGFGEPIEGGPGGPDGPEWGTEEFAKELGYGITTQMGEVAEETAMPEVAEETAMPEPTDDQSFHDPNAEYVNGLSETAQAEYYEALQGPQPTEEEMQSGEWEYDPQNAGCYGKASDEVYNVGGNILEDEKYKGLLEEMNLIYAQAGTDPKVVEAQAEWTACMTAAGHPGLADSSAAQESIYTQLNSYWDKGEEPPADLMASLQEQEKSLATADFACTKEADVDAAMTQAQHQAEQEFIDSHRAELEELMAALKEQQDAQKG